MEELIIKLGLLAERKHYYCEDSWYSCPKSEDGCSNEAYEPDVCNCGADKHNKQVKEVLEEMLEIL